jgi:hypothetical protein
MISVFLKQPLPPCIIFSTQKKDELSMKKAFLILLGLIAISISSCSLDDGGTNFHFVPLKIVAADLPESFTLNETYQVNVTYELPNNCSFFEGFDVTKANDSIRNVVVIGTELEQQDCNTETVERQSTFSFICLYSQTYVFRFWTGEDDNGEAQYFEIEVPVE